MADIVDLTIDSFDKQKWIGCHLIYPEHPPVGLVMYYEKTHLIPDSYRHFLLPDPEMSISRLLELGMPSVTTIPEGVVVERCFSKDPPVEDFRKLLTCNIPSLDFVRRAREASKQAMLDGYISFIDSKYEVTAPQPIWIIHFWEEIHAALEAIDTWTKCKKWLIDRLDQSATQHAIQECLVLFDTLGWNKPITHTGAIDRTLQLAQILANSMIQGTVVDAMVLNIRNSLSSDTVYQIETLPFMEMVTQLWNNPGRVIPYLNELEKRLRSSMNILWFPVNIRSRKHYQAFKIDFRNGTISYGDSSIHENGMYGYYTEIFEPLTWWLSRFPSNFVNLGCIIHRGFQNDDVSCAFAAVNMIAFEVLGESLWNPTRALYVRCAWFIRFASDTDRAIENGKLQDPVIALPVHDESSDVVMSSTLVEQVQNPAELKPMNTVIKEVHPFFGAAATTTAVLKNDKRKRLFEPENDPVKSIKSKQPKIEPPSSEQGRSATYTRLRNESVENGTFVDDPVHRENFEYKIRILDKKAQFFKNPRIVRHSTCGKNLKMKEPYHTEKFRIHLEVCKASGKGAGMNTLDSFFNKPVPSPSNGPKGKMVVKPTQPCPGLTKNDDKDIPTYLKRTPALGGGAPTKASIAEEMYDSSNFKDLESGMRKSIEGIIRLRYKWRNEIDLEVVRSTSCTGIALRGGPCVECNTVLTDKIFRNALRRKLPPPENVKYTPHIWVNEKVMNKYSAILGFKPIMDAYRKNPKNPCILYAEGVINGDFNDEVVFTGIVNAVVQRKELEKKGSGLQGFKYAPEVKELAHIINISSARAYQSIRKILQLPTPRSLQIITARQPRFPIGIKSETFDFVTKHLMTLKYDGPLNLSCDDTQLFAALRPFYDGNTEQYYIMGNVGEPLVLSDPESFSETIRAGNIEKATKLRLWVIQIPMPGIPAIVAAAMAISSACNANQLEEYSYELIIGFINRGLKILGYSTDGSAVERLVQIQLEARAPKKRSLTIKGRQYGQSDITFDIPLFGESGQAVVMLQDSKHAAKTYRNNGYSGAQMVVLANYPVLYEQLRELGTHNEGPLFLRDVERVDRQDDGAALRLFSSTALEWFTKHRPEQLGPVVYLFVFGELVDAYQNRHIGHFDRVVMVLRAHYFIEIWIKVINTTSKDKSQIISAQALKITRSLVEGLIKLIVLYSELPETYPLLPWLYSTEVNEHIFGICRQILPDFTMLDFYYMAPKLFIRLREASLFKETSDGRERASGYTFTGYDNRDIDLNALSIMLTPEQLEEGSEIGFMHAKNLWIMLGYNYSTTISLPPLQQRFHFDENEFVNNPDDHRDDVGGISASSIIQECLDELENVSLPGQEYENQVNSLAFASVALTLNDSENILAMPEPDDTERANILASESKMIQTTLDACLSSLPSLSTPEGCITSRDFKPSDLLNLPALVKVRASHERRQAVTGIRTNSQQAIKSLEERTGVEPTRYALLRKFNQVIRNLQEKPQTSTVGRTIRWQPGRNPATGINDEIGLSGNFANAVEAANKRSKDAVTRRTQAIIKYELPQALCSALVTKNSPLKSGDYGFIIVNGVLYVGHVLSVYSKTGGKNGRHAWTESVTTIGSASNLAMQCYEYYMRNSFRTIPLENSANHLSKFALIRSSAFLTKLQQPPSINMYNSDVEVSGSDLEEFLILQRDLGKVNLALKLINGRRTIRADDED